MRIVQSLFAGVFVLSLLAACNPTDDSTAAREKELEDYARKFGINADVKIDADGNPQVQVQQNVGGGSAQVGKNLAVPESFPKDVALYPKMAIISAAQLPIGHMLQGQSSDAPEDIAAYFRREMLSQGWRDETPADATGSVMTSMRFIKDDRAAGINLMRVGDQTTVQIALTPAG